jgi:CheY-like chemotaxis protein
MLPSKPLVLVVEDDPDTGALLTDVLGDEGYVVQVVDTALDAHEVVRRLGPQAVLLDLALPYRSGAALLADLKADPDTAAIPVIVVSAYLEALSSERAALATALIAKPFEVHDLFAAIQAAA